ncbi:unnamed protein product, partial [Notodromas monacha]
MNKTLTVLDNYIPRFFKGVKDDRPVSTWASQVKKTPQSPQSEAEQEAKTYILCCKMWLYIVFAGLVGLVTGMPHLHHNVGTSKSNHLTIEDFIAAKNDDFSFHEAQEDVLNGRNPELGEHFEGDIILPEGVNPQNGILQDSKLWPNAIVPYTITGNFSMSMSHTPFPETGKNIKLA